MWLNGDEVSGIRGRGAVEYRICEGPTSGRLDAGVDEEADEVAAAACKRDRGTGTCQHCPVRAESRLRWKSGSMRRREGVGRNH